MLERGDKSLTLPSPPAPVTPDLLGDPEVPQVLQLVQHVISLTSLQVNPHRTSSTNLRRYCLIA